jgi:hypothetical protein
MTLMVSMEGAWVTMVGKESFHCILHIF